MQSSHDSGNTAAGANGPHDLVRHIDLLEWQVLEGGRWARAFGPPEGTKHLTFYAGELGPGKSHTLDPGGSEAVGYLLGGRGKATIGGREFAIASGDGFHIRAGEACTLHVEGGVLLRILVVICPSVDKLPWSREFRGFAPPPKSFDGAYPERVVSLNRAEKEISGDRWFRVLIGPKTGSEAVTQFVGSIPVSKAPEHYHHYEEVICVLSGEGRLWLGDQETPVRSGSLIFLPREQPHCLECTSMGGLELLGMFYPAGSPAVNYETGDSA